MNIRLRRRNQGFTLVELMIVVVILGILAAIVIPQFTSAAEESRASATKMDLARIRQQIEIYKQQHDDYPALADIADQMTLASDGVGDTAAVGTAGYALGPYLREIPTNPYTNTRDIGDGNVGDSAWYYDESTGEFLANSEADHRNW